MKSLKFNKIVKSPEECINLGVEFSKFISNGDIIILEGELGSGKTTFVRILAGKDKELRGKVNLFYLNYILKIPAAIEIVI